MIRQSPLLVLWFMSFCIETQAQKEQPARIQWQIAGTLPSAEQGSALGLAGAISGVHNDILIVGGGANFPDAMPWMGGQKKYYDVLFAFKKTNTGKIVATGTTFRLPSPTAYGASCSTPFGVVYAGGENESGAARNVLLIQWDAVAEDIVVQDLPVLPRAVTHPSIAFDKDIV